MYDQDNAGEHVAALLRTKLDGDVAHSIGGKSVSRFTTAYPFTRDGAAVSAADVIEEIEDGGFQIVDFQNSQMMGRARLDASPADSETFIVDRIATMPDGTTVIMILNTDRTVRFANSVADDAVKLALTRNGDLVTTFSRMGSEKVTGFRNRTLERRISTR